MTGKSHMKIALSVSLFTANPFIIAGAVLGSLIPDIDLPTSKLSKVLPGKGWPFSKLKHRGFTHSIISLLIMSAVTYFTFKSTSVCIGVFMGYLSHIISDMMTIQGVQLLWPKHRFYRIGFNIKTGSPMEYGAVALIVVCGVAGAFKLWEWF